MPTPTVPPAPTVAVDAWLSALAIAQPGVSASSPPAAPSGDASTSTPPAAQPANTGAAPKPIVPGMPKDAESTPTTITSTTVAPPSGGPASQAATRPDFFMLLAFGTLFLFVVIFSSSRQAKKEKKKRDELMSSLRRNDKVQTIGGMIGTVVELKDDEVVIQGENPGSKFRFSRSAIQQVLRSSGSADAPAGGSTPEVEVKSAKEGSKV